MSIFRNIASAYTDDIISVVKVNLNNDDPKNIIDEILEIYRRFSLVSGLKNKDTITVYGTRFDKDDDRMVELTDYLTQRHEADISNIWFKGD